PAGGGFAVQLRRMLNRTCSRKPHEIVCRHYGKRCVDRVRPSATSADHSGKPTTANYAPAPAAATAPGERLDEDRDRARHPARLQCPEQFAAFGTWRDGRGKVRAAGAGAPGRGYFREQPVEKQDRRS